MNITEFFEHSLGAKLKNPRWSWGAFNENQKRLYLRVWSDGFDDENRKEYTQIDWDHRVTNSPGYNERTSQIERAKRHGFEVYGIVCDPLEPPGQKARKIALFNSSDLLKLGDVVHRQDKTWAKVEGWVPVSVLRGAPTKQDAMDGWDDPTFLQEPASSTEKETLTKARVGQGEFRGKVLDQWNGRCAVTGSPIQEIVRASHIKPWKDSTNRERLDPMNGLPLIATLDAMFDSGYISFDDQGRMLVSPILNDEDLRTAGITKKKLRSKPSASTAAYLAYHRTEIFRRAT